MEPIVDWEARYQSAATGWERGALNPAFGEWQPFFTTLLSDATSSDDASQPIADSSVIVPGCGRSPELLAFAQLGFEVTGVDLAETAVAFQGAALAEAGVNGRAEQANLLEWQPATPVDLVYDQTCLCALHPDQWSAYEQQLHRWLKPGGHLAVLFMQTGKAGGPPFHCELDAMRALFASERWHWGSECIISEHPGGVREEGFVLTRRA